MHQFSCCIEGYEFSWIQEHISPTERTNSQASTNTIEKMADNTSSSSREELDYTISCIFYFKRKPEMTVEECWAHWRNVHAGISVPWMISHGFTNYHQVCPKTRFPPAAILTTTHRSSCKERSHRPRQNNQMICKTLTVWLSSKLHH